MEKSKIDLVISDIFMPGMNGYSLVARLRAKWPSMPVILATGFLSEETAKNMMNGSVDFIPKPIDPEKLIELIHRQLSTGNSVTADEPLPDNAARVKSNGAIFGRTV